MVAQSIAFAYAPGPPGTVHDEDDPLFLDAPEPFKRTADAVEALESTVHGAGGVVLRYGYFYGPGSAISSGGSMGEDVARRRLPIVGGGTGVWSFIHVDDAAQRHRRRARARRARASTTSSTTSPRRSRSGCPSSPRALGARPPRRVPALARAPARGQLRGATMTRAQGASNARARRELDWAPRFASWREGFASALVSVR